MSKTRTETNDDREKLRQPAGNHVITKGPRDRGRVRTFAGCPLHFSPFPLRESTNSGSLCRQLNDFSADASYGSSQAGSKYQGQRGPTPSRSYLNFVKSS